jgi:exosortase A-associated hydrolase 2
VAYPEPFYLPTTRGRRFCVRHAPASAAACLGAIVYVHPFAEEMNKSRRMAALQSRALADAGWTVLQLDLFGCGDSDGDFGQADWQQWHSDVMDATTWLSERTGCRPALWGLRAGCLLACEVAKDLEPAPNLLIWQPVASGRQFLQQFLRLKVASQLFGDSPSERVGTSQLYDQLVLGNTVEVAGYALSTGLAMGLDAAEVAPPTTPANVAWLEVGPHLPAELTPAAQVRIQSWRAAGHRVAAKAVPGATFWQTQEIAECPELIEATLAAVADWQA